MKIIIFMVLKSKGQQQTLTSRRSLIHLLISIRMIIIKLNLLTIACNLKFYMNIVNKVHHL